MALIFGVQTSLASLGQIIKTGFDLRELEITRKLALTKDSTVYDIDHMIERGFIR